MRRRFLQLGFLLAVVAVAMSVTLNAMACGEGTIGELVTFGKSLFTATTATKPADTPAVFGQESFTDLDMKFAGECEQPNLRSLRGKKTSTYRLEAKDDAKAAFERYAQNHPGHPWKRYDGQPLSETDFIAIDAMARTLIGEMGNESRCGKSYMAGAARVITNRAISLLNDSKKYGKVFARHEGSCSDFSQCIANAALMDRQFSVWNKPPRGNGQAAVDQEGVTETALCPRGGPGVHVAESQITAWKDAVKFATLAVTAPWKLKQLTPDIHAMWYTSFVDMRGGVELRDGSYCTKPDGTYDNQAENHETSCHTLNKNLCLRLWKDPCVEDGFSSPSCKAMKAKEAASRTAAKARARAAKSKAKASTQSAKKAAPKVAAKKPVKKKK